MGILEIVVIVLFVWASFLTYLIAILFRLHKLVYGILLDLLENILK